MDELSALKLLGRQTLWLGVAPMACRYAISRTWLLYAVGLALCAGLWVDRG